MPRRALMHKYPIVGRFADFARRRAYLWSFRPQHLRPAFYAGAIISLMPVMGVQLPIALVLAVVLRANFMVMGALQLLTNPFTAAPIYYVTHQVGKSIISTTGFKVDPAPVETAMTEAVAEAGGIPATAHRPRRIRDAQWVKRVGTAVNALIVGGFVCGLLLGLALDGVHKLSRRAIHRHHLHHPRHPPDTPHHKSPPDTPHHKPPPPAAGPQSDSTGPPSPPT
jgi:uncharacterized protein